MIKDRYLLSKSDTSNFPLFGVLLCFYYCLVNVVELIQSIVQENQPFLVDDMENPILQPVR